MRVDTPKHQSTAQPLIIPTSRHSYLARDTRAELTEEQKKYSKSKVGTVHIFNAKALQRASKPIFIVEGELDALSIIEVGGEAVGLGSLGNVNKLLQLLENEKPSKPFIIALDNETEPAIQAKVEKAVTELQDGLQRLNIACYRLNPCGEYKDANEALQGNREAFTAAIAEAEDIKLKLWKQSGRSSERSGYILWTDLLKIEASKGGFYSYRLCLDNLLEGGLYSGLYIVELLALWKDNFAYR